ncbi:vWA domain-containing protein [Tunicatimonas pelagia]|uniref:vWA domain-containing protein n=1 Tax=Tunicatimonas pelagia TaxID=931531 RepID=UPI0026656853|nr:von Willebrand factor type A domain-containing protein [Tunicatimonas pelagia]WKN45508.1 von Willebrand factor type A domain-containing protein [Tunicatimonas pelagia]
MKTVMIILLGLLTAFTWRPNPTQTITGTVTDIDGGAVLPGVNVIVKSSQTGTVTDMNGQYRIENVSEKDVLVFSFIGYVTQEVKVKNQSAINVQLVADVQELSEVVVTGYAPQYKRAVTGSVARIRGANSISSAPAPAMYDVVEQESGVYYPPVDDELPQEFNTEEYATIRENPFLASSQNPLSTFSIDVDAASYGNIRRFINQGEMPPTDAVRIEEMVNYFKYNYPQPKGDDPFSVNPELVECPWNPQHHLLKIGLQGKEIPTENLPASNLVFLIDVSGSMDYSNKLPLLKKAFRMLTDQLRPQDRVAMVVYAGAAGVVLESTPGNEKAKIKEALDRLQAGGSTAGGAGIQLAYDIAKKNFQDGGNNRIILATDGDFNIGESSNAAMERMIEKKREEGIFLTVLGFGMGNYKDSKMELLADKGNGNYAYIDNIQEAKKVLVSEFGGTLFTIAKDVKFQIEFNPTKVQGHRLIGYENRALRSEDFNDDKKDAGELGSGHTVTALYEVIPAGIDAGDLLKSVDDLKYQKQKTERSASRTDEWLTLKLRYKAPDGDTSKLIEQPLTGEVKSFNEASENLRFAASVAGFGMLLRDSNFKGNLTYDAVAQMARESKGEDQEGYRQEFIRLVESCNLLASN